MKPKEYYLSPVNGMERIFIKKKAILGSDKKCQIQISAALTSLKHAAIELVDEKYIIRDLNSITGTYVNEKKIHQHTLKHGDIIKINQKKYTFLEATDKCKYSHLLKSKNLKWSQQLSKIENFAKSPHPVLILGESGTGKEIISQTLHSLSSRKNSPFISINCSALSENLVESELFGHIKGSYTGATENRLGAFEAAREGTLFLDEIGDLPPSIQPKLLRALENNEIKPVGSDKAISTNVRIIAATHPKLIQKVRSGEFRSDLYFRLNVVNISPPPLTKRMEDFDTLLSQFSKDYQVGFSFNAISDLKKYSWPGNIRELKNFVARASTIVSNRKIQPEDLSDIIDPVFLSPALESSPYDISQVSASKNKSESVIDHIEKQLIKDTLFKNKGNQRKSAFELNMPKSTLHDKIKRYNISIKEITNSTLWTSTQTKDS